MNEKEMAALNEYLENQPVKYPGNIDTLIEELYCEFFGEIFSCL